VPSIVKVGLKRGSVSLSRHDVLTHGAMTRGLYPSQLADCTTTTYGIGRDLRPGERRTEPLRRRLFVGEGAVLLAKDIPGMDRFLERLGMSVTPRFFLGNEVTKSASKDSLPSERYELMPASTMKCYSRTLTCKQAEQLIEPLRTDDALPRSAPGLSDGRIPRCPSLGMLANIRQTRARLPPRAPPRAPHGRRG
jgi:hypothetical protein